MTAWNRWICYLMHGHDYVLHYAPDKLSLLCVTCFAETCGWTVTTNPPRRTE